MNARLLPLAVIAALALPSVSHAARRPFLVGHDGSMVAEGDVEVETWIDDQWNPGPLALPMAMSTDPAPLRSAWLWWFGVYWSPHADVEVRAFTSVIQRDGSATSLWAELLSARWRFLEGGFGALVAQLDLRIPILLVLPWQVQPSLTWSKKLDRFTFNAQAGYAAGFRDGPVQRRYNWITWDAGVAVEAITGEVAPVLQVGVEAFSEVVLSGVNDFNNRSGSTVNVGPTVSIAKGRLWFTAGALYGVTRDSPTLFIRALIGLAL